MENTNIKQWYMNAYPTDELGEEIRENVTFKDLLTILDYHLDVYDLLNVHDSIVRERTFERLSQLMNVEYDVVYNKWLER